MARREGDDVKEMSSQRPIVALVQGVVDTLLVPVRLLTSRFALRAYLTSVIVFITGFVLFGFAILAYLLFYWSYVPRIGFTRDIHLQYDTVPLECRSYLGQVSNFGSPASVLTALAGATPPPSSRGDISTVLSAKCAGTPSPWGTAAISPDVISQQAYDLVMELDMPLTPRNTEAGNFMVDARLLSTSDNTDTSLPSYLNAYDPYAPHSSSPTPPPTQPLAHARRPALIPYQPPLLTLFSTLTSIPRHLLGLSTSTATVRVPLFSQVSFPRGRRAVPNQLHVQLQNPSGVQLQVYRAKAQFRARFKGLRYLMYNFKMTTGAVFVGLFFVAEVVAAASVWAFLSWVVFGRSGGGKGVKGEAGTDKGEGIKREDDEEATETEGMSGTERTFPTYGKGPAMRYQAVKKEGAEDSVEGAGGASAAAAAGTARLQTTGGTTTMTPGPGGEADDEDDEDADFVLDDTDKWRDSGLGTSMESGRDRDGIRRRRSRGRSGRSGDGMR